MASSYETAKAGFSSLRTTLKMPPFGKQLATRLAYNNPPYKIIICVGADAWRSAKDWNGRPEYSAMVLPPDVQPESLQWQVKNCDVQIEWGKEAPISLIKQLRDALLRSGPNFVVVYPLFVDYRQPAELFNIHTQQWEQIRERIRVYYPKGG